MNKWKRRSMKIACAFVMALSILPGATYLLACEEDEQPVEPPVVEEPDCPVVDEPVCEPEPDPEPPVVEPEPEPEPEQPPVQEPEEPIEEPPVVEVPKEEEPVVDEPIKEEPNNNNENKNENNINIDIDIQQQQQQQQKQEQQLKKDNPVAYLKQKSKQVTTKKQTLVVENHSPSNTKKSYVKGKDYINGKGPIDENYVEGKGPIDEDYVENPETGEEDILIACGAAITGASALLVIIRKVLIKI